MQRKWWNELKYTEILEALEASFRMHGKWTIWSFWSEGNFKECKSTGHPISQICFLKNCGTCVDKIVIDECRLIQLD